MAVARVLRMTPETANERQDCRLCRIVDGRSELPGGAIHETDLWLVMHVLGAFGPGTLAVLPRRHRLNLGELADDETAGLGEVLRDTVAVVESVTRPARIYTCMWSHTNGKPAHIHFVIQPILEEDMNNHPNELGPMLQTSLMSEQGKRPQLEIIDSVANRARAAWPRGRLGGARA